MNQVHQRILREIQLDRWGVNQELIVDTIGMAPVVLLLLALPLWWVLSVARDPKNESTLFRNTPVSIKVAD